MAEGDFQDDARGAEISGAAARWIGTPYLHQSTLCGVGTDCLGLIRGVWREVVGPEPVVPPHYTQDWAEPSGDEVLLAAAGRWLIRKSRREIGLGDVVLFRMRAGAVAKHLGIVSAVGKTRRLVHAYSGHGVVENTFSDPWVRRMVAVFQFPERMM